MNRQHDIEGEFSLYSTSQSGRKTAVFSGYRPIHKLYDNYLSSGQHEYPDVGQVAPGKTARVFAWLITPEVYPGSLWIGRELDVMEGPNHVVGKLKVTRILNNVLAGSAEAYSPHWVETLHSG
jgi:hypothetical protein